MFAERFLVQGDLPSMSSIGQPNNDPSSQQVSMF